MGGMFLDWQVLATLFAGKVSSADCGTGTLPSEHRVARLTPDRMPPCPACKIRGRCGEAGREAPDPESDVLAARRQPVRGRDRSASLIYINWYINGYRRPWTSSDVNPRISPVHGQVAAVSAGCHVNH
jgi:hypothetical protein